MRIVSITLDDVNIRERLSLRAHRQCIDQWLFDFHRDNAAPWANRPGESDREKPATETDIGHRRALKHAELFEYVVDALPGLSLLL